MQYKILFLLPLVFALSISIFAQKRIDQNAVSPWLLGASVKGFETRLPLDKSFTFFEQDASNFSFNYGLDLQYSLSPKLFLTSGVGFSTINRVVDNKINFTFSEDGNVSGSANQTILPVERNWNSDFHANTVNFLLVSFVDGDEIDLKEGEQLYLRYRDEYSLNYLSLPLMINAKLSRKKLSLYAGLGTNVNFNLNEKRMSSNARQYGFELKTEKEYFYPDMYRWQNRNNVMSLIHVQERTNANVIVDAVAKIGLIHEHPINTFVLDLVYSKSLTSFAFGKKMESLGVNIGWRIRLGKNADLTKI